MRRRIEEMVLQLSLVFVAERVAALVDANTCLAA
jgi:hypothetical protein